jgi:hypothetical protein
LGRIVSTAIASGAWIFASKDENIVSISLISDSLFQRLAAAIRQDHAAPAEEPELGGVERRHFVDG